MDVLDEASAFFRIFSNGRSVADIAARFGYSEMLIERRLALARLSPTLMANLGKPGDGQTWGQPPPF